MTFTKTAFIILFVTLPFWLFAQETGQKQEDPVFYLTGTVKDANSGDVLPGVNVYLAGTTNGDMTDSEGVYAFRSDLVGTLDLVFSFVGYKRKVVKVHLIPSDEVSIKTKTVNMELTPETLNMRSIEVVSSNKEWQDNYRQFVKQFVGLTSFAEETEILNSWVLEFEDSPRKGYVQATSDRPLVLENRALGYYLHIELAKYEWTKTGTEGLFKVYPRFELMEPKNEDVAERWEENREKAYEGSLKHFLTSLYNTELKREGFTVTSRQDVIPLAPGQVRFELLGRENATPELVSVLKGYRLHREVRVEYGRINEHQTAMFGGSPFNIKTSELYPARESRTFFIDAGGNLFNPTALKLRGEWSNHRMANRLPMNYSWK